MRLWHAAAAAESAAMPLPVCNDRLLYVPALIIQICLRIYRLFAGSANPRRMGSCINKALLLTIAFWLLAILSPHPTSTQNWHFSLVSQFISSISKNPVWI